LGKNNLTHGEIGQYIGLGRETVSLFLADFKNRELVEQSGTTLVISSLRALEIYAGQLWLIKEAEQRITLTSEDRASEKG
jgi:hypothetical protein